MEVQSASLTGSPYRGSLLTGGGPPRGPNTVLGPQHQGIQVPLRTLPESQNSSPKKMSSWMRDFWGQTPLNLQARAVSLQSVCSDDALGFQQMRLLRQKLQKQGWRQEGSLN